MVEHLSSNARDGCGAIGLLVLVVLLAVVMGTAATAVVMVSLLCKIGLSEDKGSLMWWRERGAAIVAALWR